MFKGKLSLIFASFCLGLLWSVFGNSAHEWFNLSISETFKPFIPLFTLFLLFEVVARLLFWSVLAPITHIPIASQRPSLGRWKPSAHSQLEAYTNQLEQFGFTLLTDYTFTTSVQRQPSPLTARLFVHPQNFVFAELAQVENLPISCALSTYLENHWEMAVTNMPTTNTIDAISHAFMRQPKTLVRRLKGESIDGLIQSLLSWRHQVCADLAINVSEETDADAYFRRDASRRNRNRSRLLRSSVTWRVLEVIWFACRPVKEWLGDYSPAR